MVATVRHFLRNSLMALPLLISPFMLHADELMKWERIPLSVPLKVGQERVIFADKNVRVGFPPALNGKLRVQSTGGAVYLKADSAFHRHGCGCRMWRPGKLFCSMSPPVNRGLLSRYVLCMTVRSARSVRRLT